MRRLRFLAVAVIAVSSGACEAGDDQDAAGAAVVSIGDDGTAGNDETSPPVDTAPPTTTSLATVPPTSVPRTSGFDSAERFNDLPAADPITLRRRPGELWPMSDIAQYQYNGLQGFTATEERNGSETIRTVTYDHRLFPCDIDGAAQAAEPPNCTPFIIVQARFGAPQPSTSTASTVPLTGDGEVWADQSTDPGDIPLCLESQNCSSSITVERRIGDVPITITFPHGIPADMLTKNDSYDHHDSYIQLARSIYLFDEYSGAPVDSFPPYHIDPTTEFAWFRGISSGPLVAVTDDGEHELRVRNDGTNVTFYPDDEPDVVYPITHYQTSSDDPVLGNCRSGRSRAWVYGMTEPEVAELVFEFPNGDEPVTVVPADLTGTFRHQFFMIEVARSAINPWRHIEGTTVHALDANGNELATYGVFLDGWDLQAGGERMTE